ncbi:MAG: protein kinase [Myxococcales bacterium]|nr:protein kinase [Myxococcales bacterium]
MLARDGRVRVLDFGLSRLHAGGDDEPSLSASGRALALTVTGVGALLGTPAYMSPEQHDRDEVDARSDQFSFCVSLWEALFGRRPYAGETVTELTASMRRGELVNTSGSGVPAWVRRVLERGLLVEPSLRWPGMDALLAALDRDPARTRRRLLAVAAGVVAIAGVSYGVAAHRVAEAQVCSGAAEELADVWGAERRAAVVSAIQATGVAYAERAAAASVEHLDHQAARWVAVHTASCTSHQRGHTSPLLFDRRMACLRQRRSELAATAAVLAQTTRDTVAQVVDTARGLPPIRLCEDDERQLAAVAPPEDPLVAAAVEDLRGRLARLQALERIGQHAEALAGVTPMIGEAERLGFLPARAEVHLLAGKLLMYHARPEARAHLEQTLEWSLAARADEIAAETLAVTVFDVAAIEHRPHDALALLPAAWGLMHRIDDPPRLTALLHSNAGSAHDELGEPRKAIAAYEQGLALLVAHAPEDPLRWAIVNNLALSLTTVGEFERASASLRTALPVLERTYDPCYLLASVLRSTLAKSDAGAGRVADGLAGYEAALACIGPDLPAYEVNMRGELARLYHLLGDDLRTQQEVARSEALIAGHPDARAEGLDIALVRIDDELRRGALDDARRSLVELLTPPDAGDVAARRWQTSAEIRRGLLAHLGGDDVAAQAHLQRVEGLLGPGAALDNDERGLLAFTRARVLRALGRDPIVVKKAVVDAIAAYTSAGAPYRDTIAEIRRWQAEPAP